MTFKKERRKVLARLGKWLAAVGLASRLPLRWALASEKSPYQGDIMKLPPPEKETLVSVESAIENRRTIRSYGAGGLQPAQLSRLLWAAQGITGSRGFKRAAPSAGALYPMDIYAVVGKNGVAGIDAGIYHFDPSGPRLAVVVEQDLRKEIARASLSQMWMARAPVNLVITAEYSRITGKYGRRGVRYAMIEAGHIGQNLFLQAAALGLAAGIVGAFDDQKLADIMQIPAAHEPLLVMPVGRPA